MEINRAIILCAGFGKRVLPLTSSTPKPLLKVNEISLIEYSILLLKQLGVREIAVNVHYLKDKIISYLENKHPQIKIFQEKVILDTGGALINAKSFFTEDYFFVLNSDTIWQKNYIPSIKSLIKKTTQNSLLAGLLLAEKKNSFDPNLEPDFSLNNNLLVSKKEYIYTGFQVLNSKLLHNKTNEPFSVKEIWDDLINKKKITGEIFKNTFFHTTNINIYEMLKNKNITF